MLARLEHASAREPIPVERLRSLADFCLFIGATSSALYLRAAAQGKEVLPHLDAATHAMQGFADAVRVTGAVHWSVSTHGWVEEIHRMRIAGIREGWA